MKASPRKPVDIYALITETEFQDSVIDRARLYKWWWWHDQDSRRNESGLPDLILVRPPRIIFAELKKETGRVSVTQRAVLAMLNACPGVETYVWRPSDERALDAILRGE